MKKRLKAWGNDYLLPIVCCVLVNERGEVLLLKRHSKDLGGGKYGFPGGRIESGETTEQAIKREVFEETGISPTSLSLIGRHEIHMPHGSVHMTTYKATAPNTIDVVLDPNEHEDFLWLLPEAAPTTNDLLYGVPSLLRDYGMLENLIEDQTLPSGSRVVLLKDTEVL